MLLIDLLSVLINLICEQQCDLSFLDKNVNIANIVKVNYLADA